MPKGIYNHKSMSEETKLKMSLAKKGKMPKFIPDNTGRIRIDMLRENHFNWKDGRSVHLTAYRALHHWVQKQLGKANHCEINLEHKSTRYHWANISHEYKKDLSDWMQMCPSCNCKDRRILP